ncbi:hypothetical protein BJ085DRAFT_40155 [Dimargaris cristalligena]|uniref:PHD-type domain-containing protein n=1 Tax=Dimargaris cristalligena TaxID=215637 RepID=A0A4P9ZP18_9FUNG|nr:hypothetical protein BJ085DRAFT_40155 [Dimargaris cristalligena]|eukprot:RKP34955.1 hypothetical protein BJ085DRAFT_40155 [Dimargaris cristalligena]
MVTRSRLSTTTTPGATPAASGKRGRRTLPTGSATPGASAFVSTGAFLTRSVLKRLAEHSTGFVEEFHQFKPMQQVMVRRGGQQWYQAQLTLVSDGRVKAEFEPELGWPPEWVPIDSRRLLSLEDYGKLHQPVLKRPRVGKPPASAETDLTPTPAAVVTAAPVVATPVTPAPVVTAAGSPPLPSTSASVSPPLPPTSMTVSPPLPTTTTPYSPPIPPTPTAVSLPPLPTPTSVSPSQKDSPDPQHHHPRPTVTPSPSRPPRLSASGLALTPPGHCSTGGCDPVPAEAGKPVVRPTPPAPRAVWPTPTPPPPSKPINVCFGTPVVAPMVYLKANHLPQLSRQYTSKFITSRLGIKLAASLVRSVPPPMPAPRLALPIPIPTPLTPASTPPMPLPPPDSAVAQSPPPVISPTETPSILCNHPPVEEPSCVGPTKATNSNKLKKGQHQARRNTDNAVGRTTQRQSKVKVNGKAKVGTRAKGKAKDKGKDKSLLNSTSEVTYTDGIEYVNADLVVARGCSGHANDPMELSEMEAMVEPCPDDYDPHWTIYCNCCNRVIKQVRFYCTYCESPSEGFDYKSFELCVYCFEHRFPIYHMHPRSSFAMQWLIAPGDQSTVGGTSATHITTSIDPALFNVLNNSSSSSALDQNGSGSHGSNTIDPLALAGEIVQSFEKDQFDTNYKAPDPCPDNGEQDFEFYKKYMSRKICAFCLDDEKAPGSKTGPFIGPYPFVYPVSSRKGTTKFRQFWAHDACARYSPEVVVVNDEWYNVTAALKRGRQMKCIRCREKGATIGCFHSKCNRSYHFGCTNKPLSYFKEGVIFWCPQHESHLHSTDQYEDVFSCDRCSKSLVDETSWITCSLCSQDYFSSYDLCYSCAEVHTPEDHHHSQELFQTTSWAKIAELKQAEEEQRCALRIRSSRSDPDATARSKGQGGGVSSGGGNKAKRNQQALLLSALDGMDENSLSDIQCSYCPNFLAPGWRRGFGGMLMCKDCYDLTLNQLHPTKVLDSTDSDLQGVGVGVVGGGEKGGDISAGLPLEGVLLSQYLAPIEDYSFTTYLTRASVISATMDQPMGDVPELESLGPSEAQLFSLAVDSTYYDIPGRAPRWATHSGSDYHGTWLPQTVRRALLRYTRPHERILSNFLGRGTDAIESMLLKRRCVGIDINPLAVDRSKRNCSFRVPLDTGITAEHRPVIFLGDARSLIGPGLDPESFDHVLSHPPYKNCVLYSKHIDGDLSRFPGSNQFIQEMDLVILETRRLLKMNRRVTLGIGDNRKDCFYTPVSFHLFRQYLSRGFELEELVIKRQRYCQAFGLGTELCTKFDFLMFTHEFIATFRKCPVDDVVSMVLEDLSTFVWECQTSDQISSPEGFELRRHARAIPLSPIVRTSRPMGTVWTFLPNTQYDLGALCLSRILERFGTDGANWEEVSIVPLATEDALPLHAGIQPDSDLKMETITGVGAGDGDDNDGEVFQAFLSDGSSTLVTEDPTMTSDSESDTDDGEDGDDDPDDPANLDPDASTYEQERLRKIKQNKRALMSMGLISDLNDDVADDIPHYELMNSLSLLDDGMEEGGSGGGGSPLALLAVPHLAGTTLDPACLPGYRRLLVAVALDALQRLTDTGGVLAIGVQDVRCPRTGKLWPLGLLVFEDIRDAVLAADSPFTLRLKELMIAVPDGYGKDRKKTYTLEDYPEEVCVADMDPVPAIPIVHAYYLIFRKVKRLVPPQ